MTIAAGEQALAADLLVALAADGKLLDHDHTGDAGDGGVVGVVPDHDHSGDAGDGGVVAVVPDHDHTGDSGDGGTLSCQQAEVDLRTAGNYTTTSGTFVDVDATNITITMTTRTGSVLIMGAVITTSHSANAKYIRFDIDIGGTREGGTYGLAMKYHPSLGIATWQGFTHVKTGLSAGEHTFKLQWRTSAATATLYGNADVEGRFFVVEVY